MVTELELKQMVQQILTEMSGKDGGAPKGSPAAAQCVACDDGDGLPDLTEIDLRRHCLVPNPANREALMAMKLTTPSRIGVWRAGPRYMTETLLRFRADHAAAQDAVFTNVSDEFLEANKLETVQTECTSKDQFLTRPDLGRRLSKEAIETIQAKCKKNPQVQVVISDGLSTDAITANFDPVGHLAAPLY